MRKKIQKRHARFQYEMLYNDIMINLKPIVYPNDTVSFSYTSFIRNQYREALFRERQYCPRIYLIYNYYWEDSV